MSGSDVPSTRAGIATWVALAASWGLAFLYVAVALAAMWHSPRVPYADGWGFLGHFASKPVVQEVLRQDNGHHEVLPHAVRMLELRFFDAQQWLQVWVGIGLLVATLIGVWSLLRSEQSSERRAAAALIAALGFCWLGNIRALGHANESVHAYLVTLCVALGIAVLTRRKDGPPQASSAACAALLGVVAAFSFSSGLAAFIAFVVVALLQRSRLMVYLLLGGTFIATVALRRWGNAGLDAVTLQFAPLAQFDLLLRWLAGPAVYAVWPLTDPALAVHVPTTPLRALAEWMASAWHDAFGPVMRARWPHVLVGTLGVCWLILSTWRARTGASRAALLGIGLAWFAFSVGGLIAAVRLEYFELHRGELLAPRYVVWSSLFWAGLAISAIAGAQFPKRSALAVVVVALGLMPSQVWMWRLGQGMWQVADRTAVAAAVGVLEPTLETGETLPDQLAAVLPALRNTRAAVFAWQETALLGQRLDRIKQQSVPADRMSIDRVGNLLGEPGRRVRFIAKSGKARLVLVDGDGIARGIAIPDPETGGWLGWMRGSEQRGPLRAFSLR